MKMGKESPDSTGQRTGEQPASSQEERDSATENNCLFGEGENVG